MLNECRDEVLSEEDTYGTLEEGSGGGGGLKVWGQACAETLRACQSNLQLSLLQRATCESNALAVRAFEGGRVTERAYDFETSREI